MMVQRQYTFSENPFSDFEFKFLSWAKDVWYDKLLGCDPYLPINYGDIKLNTGPCNILCVASVGVL